MYIKKYNLFFLHIPKTAGTSIKSYLTSIDENITASASSKNAREAAEFQWFSSHAHTPLSIHYNNFLTRDLVLNAEKFTVVRSPIGRLKSLYFFTNFENEKYSLSEFLPLIYKDLRKIKSEGVNPNVFLSSIPRNSIGYSREEGYFYDVRFLVPQVDFFNVKTDNVTVLKFENLIEDFKSFTKDKNLPSYSLPKFRVSSPEDYTDELFLKEISEGHSVKKLKFVLDFYVNDFKEFGYNL